MESLPRIWMDWNEGWGDNLYSLHLPYTLEHFAKQGIEMREGLKIRLFGDELEADAVVVHHEFNNHKFWCAKVVEGTMIDVPFIE
jgi:hypothetical protein